MPGDAAVSPALSGARMDGASATGPATASSISFVTAPGRRMVGFPTSESTVDSTPKRHGPPSMMRSIFPSMSCRTCSAIVGLGLPEVLALGAATGTPASRISASAVLLSGIRTATVSSPAVTSSGTAEDRLKMSVSGPGQNASINVRAASGMRVQSCFTSFFFATCRMSGLSPGLPLASKMRRTASPSSPFAPRP